MVLICEWREFQAEGLATQNALPASFVLVLGTTKSPHDAECKRSSLQVLDMSTKYEDTEPWTMSNISIYNLSVIFQ